MKGQRTNDGGDVPGDAAGRTQVIDWTDPSGDPWRVEMKLGTVDGTEQPIEISLRTTDGHPPKPITHAVLMALPLARLLQEQTHLIVILERAKELDAWSDWVKAASISDEALAPIRKLLEEGHESGRWREPAFWPALLRLYDAACEQTDQPTVAVAATLNTTPNAARTLLHRARQKAKQIDSGEGEQKP